MLWQKPGWCWHMLTQHIQVCQTYSQDQSSRSACISHTLTGFLQARPQDSTASNPWLGGKKMSAETACPKASARLLQVHVPPLPSDHRYRHAPSAHHWSNARLIQQIWWQHWGSAALVVRLTLQKLTGCLAPVQHPCLLWFCHCWTDSFSGKITAAAARAVENLTWAETTLLPTMPSLHGPPGHFTD